MSEIPSSGHGRPHPPRGLGAAETARALFGCGAGVGVGTATTRGGEAAFSDAAGPSPKRGEGVFCGLGVSSSSRSDFDFAVFFVFPDASVALDFFFAIVGFGVGVWRRFVFGEGLAL